MRSGKTLRWCGALALAFLGTQPAQATFHLMQIEQVTGGVCGDVNSQAIQLRMCTGFQQFVSAARLIAYDAQGLNPVLVIDFVSDVPNGGVGVRILITTPQFSLNHGPIPDFTMTNPIPASYMAVGGSLLARLGSVGRRTDER